MTKRIKEICSLLSPCDTFADVGCDHGYCTEYALRKGLCKRAYISDISAESLKKAQRLLHREIAAEKCIPVVCDGLRGVNECDLVLIAGLGGEEIVRILSERELPKRFVLQPMHNSEKVRAFLLSRGARIDRDYTFADGGYFYDAVTGESTGGDSYTALEIAFGRENLRDKPEAFCRKIFTEREKILGRLERPMSDGSRRELEERLGVLEVVVDAIEGNI